MNYKDMTDEELFALHTETRHIEPENDDQRRYKAKTMGAVADELARRFKSLLGEGWVSASKPPAVPEHDGRYFRVVDGDTVEIAWYDGEDWYDPIGEGIIYGAVTLYKPVVFPTLPSPPQTEEKEV